MVTVKIKDAKLVRRFSSKWRKLCAVFALHYVDPLMLIMFMLIQDLAVRSYMCEDGATGGTYLMRLRKWRDGPQCPVEITPIQKTLVW